MDIESIWSCSECEEFLEAEKVDAIVNECFYLLYKEEEATAEHYEEALPKLLERLHPNHNMGKLNCPSSKGNHAPNPKIERPYGKTTKSKKFLKSVKNWSIQLT